MNKNWLDGPLTNPAGFLSRLSHPGVRENPPPDFYARLFIFFPVGLLFLHETK
ncbi:MAG: hypothetical protein ACO3ZG_06340 [Kiritimatiellia bacterium]